MSLSKLIQKINNIIFARGKKQYFKLYKALHNLNKLFEYLISIFDVNSLLHWRLENKLVMCGHDVD